MLLRKNTKCCHCTISNNNGNAVIFVILMFCYQTLVQNNRHSIVQKQLNIHQTLLYISQCCKVLYCVLFMLCDVIYKYINI